MRVGIVPELRDECVFFEVILHNGPLDPGSAPVYETQLAKASMARVDQRNPENVYHITGVSELQAFAPN